MARTITAPPDRNPAPDETMPDACIGDYPHIGADKYGFYVTTNEYPFFTDGFNSAQIYALSKHKLANNDSSVPWVQMSDTKLANEKRGPVGLTIWPSVSSRHCLQHRQRRDRVLLEL